MTKRKFPKLLGVVNSTPDSFSDNATVAEAIARGVAMLEAGADGVDVGGESTRPGSGGAGTEEETSRVVPVIAAIRERFPNAFISVDTRKSEVAGAAVAAGANCVNDVGMLAFDGNMASTVAHLGCGVIIAHNRGTPEPMASLAVYEDVVSEVKSELLAAVEKALAAGVGGDKIIVDPNLGFAKTGEHNLEILRKLEVFGAEGYPVLVGHSRKRFLGAICGEPEARERDAATLALSVALRGRADWLRVHNIKWHLDAFKVLRALEAVS